ncbi:hypothetical protein AgCh_014403 [Apium graveolens]
MKDASLEEDPSEDEDPSEESPTEEEESADECEQEGEDDKTEEVLEGEGQVEVLADGEILVTNARSVIPFEDSQMGELDVGSVTIVIHGMSRYTFEF